MAKPNKELEKYLKMQKTDLIRAFKDNTHYPIGVREPQIAVNSNHLIPKWNWDYQSNKHKRSFIRTIKINGVEHKEYWVNVHNKNYRRNFKRFLLREYGVTTLPKNFHVDHLLNKAYAIIAGLNYVRVALVRDQVNTTAGSSNEKGFTDFAKSGIGIKNKVFFIDYSIIMKAFGIMPFKNQKDLEKRIDSVAEELAKLTGENEELIKEHLFTFFQPNWWPVFPEQSPIRKKEFKKK